MGVQVDRFRAIETASINIYVAKPGQHGFIETYGPDMPAHLGERRLQEVRITPEAGQDEYEIPQFEVNASRLAISGIYVASTRMVTLRMETDSGVSTSKPLRVEDLRLHAVNMDVLQRHHRHSRGPRHEHSGWYHMDRKRVKYPGYTTYSMVTRIPRRIAGRTETLTGYYPGEVRVSGTLSVQRGMRTVR